ncbi:MAG: hypothetical protein ACPG51_17920 [Thiolinea sp.]
MFQKLHFFKKRDLASLAIATSLIVGGFAIAKTQPKPSPLQNSMAAYTVALDNAGNEVLQPASEVAPGQLVEYALTYSNTGNSALKDIVVTGPIPSATAYIGQSAFTHANAQLQVSIDGGNTFEAEPVKRIFTDASGKQIEKIIPPSQYTHVRWNMKQPLNAGETQQFAYRSVVK